MSPVIGIFLRRALATAIPVALLACAAFSGSAEASTVVRLHATAVTAPAWEGQRALVLVNGDGGYALREVNPASGATIGSTRVGRRYGQTLLAASSSLTALEGVETRCVDDCRYRNGFISADDLRVGPSGSTLACIAALHPVERQCGPTRICTHPIERPLVSGPVLVEVGCTPSGEGIATLSDGKNVTGTVPEISFPEALAGPWLVGLGPNWQQDLGPHREPPRNPPELVERNLLTGAEPVKLVLPEPKEKSENPFEGGELPAIATVSEDGRVDYLLPGEVPSSRTLWTISPTEPTPRAIGPALIGAGFPESDYRMTQLIARGSLLAEEGNEGTLQVTNLTTGAVLGSIKPHAREGFDFDGTRLLFVHHPCSETFLATWAPGEPEPSLPNGGCTADRIVHANVGGKRISVTLACPSDSLLGCPTTWVQIHSIRADSSSITLVPGASHRFTIVPSRYGRRWLSKHHRDALKISTGTLQGEQEEADSIVATTP
jgi:hypothetical protein